MNGKTAADRLREIDVLGSQIDDQNFNEYNDSASRDLEADILPTGSQLNGDVLMSEPPMPKNFKSVKADDLLKNANADMMKRVRTTAKWSQLYKSGITFPPKHKVLFIS